MGEKIHWKSIYSIMGHGNLIISETIKMGHHQCVQIGITLQGIESAFKQSDLHTKHCCPFRLKIEYSAADCWQHLNQTLWLTNWNGFKLWGSRHISWAPVYQLWRPGYVQKELVCMKAKLIAVSNSHTWRQAKKSWCPSLFPPQIVFSSRTKGIFIGVGVRA